MSKSDLSLNPHPIQGREDAWWYEETRGMVVVVEPQKSTTQVFIPWRLVRAALERLDKP